MLRIFRESIAPSAGNNDAIHGALVNLLHRATLAVSDGQLMAGVFRFYMMGYIFHELYDAVMGKKTPPYAPYVMKLIKAKYPFDDDDVLDVDVALDCEMHKWVRMHKKNAHISLPSAASEPSGSRGPQDLSLKKNVKDGYKNRSWCGVLLRRCFV